MNVWVEERRAKGMVKIVIVGNVKHNNIINQHLTRNSNQHTTNIINQKLSDIFLVTFTMLW